ncbi:MAG: trypsin-like peptidase domain-containing protein [Candidatus Obscuribacterales bacterium]|nr:trypsin-like peptidase domain-containing protein [Candidatus Obscuribacterales bacterium]
MQKSGRALILVGALLASSLTLMPSPGLSAPSTKHSAAMAIELSGNSIADIAEAAAPAVVNLEMIRKIPLSSMPGGNMLKSFPGMEFFYNGKKVSPDQGDESGNGGADSGPFQEKRDTASGFIIRADGYILTNAHAVKDQDVIKVTLNDKRVFEAKVVGVDYFSDLAVVKIDCKDKELPCLEMGSSSNLRPGEFVVAIGSPLGYDHTVTLGIISAVGRTVTDVNGNINFIQTDAAINPGNSGGPLLNLKGEVIGVNTAIRRDAQNIGFSIPVDMARTVSTELIAHGGIARPWLGVMMKEVDDVTAKGLGVPSGTKGVLIAGFVQGSPGAAGGLKLNDVIVKIDGKDMLSPKEVKECVQGHKVGDNLSFMVLRNNSSQAISVSVGTYPNPAGKH